MMKFLRFRARVADIGMMLVRWTGWRPVEGGTLYRWVMEYELYQALGEAEESLRVYAVGGERHPQGESGDREGEKS